MARVNVYLPDDLAAETKAAGLNVSKITQEALKRELHSERMAAWIAEVRKDPPIKVDPEIMRAAIAGAKDDIEGLTRGTGP
ncbi:MAG TPA: type II toxin-antitoxin system CcdA family antitoxin [Acidimicrobiia bacterium]